MRLFVWATVLSLYAEGLGTRNDWVLEGLSHPIASNNEDSLAQVFRIACVLKVVLICVPVGWSDQEWTKEVSIIPTVLTDSLIVKRVWTASKRWVRWGLKDNSAQGVFCLPVEKPILNPTFLPGYRAPGPVSQCDWSPCLLLQLFPTESLNSLLPVLLFTPSAYPAGAISSIKPSCFWELTGRSAHQRLSCSLFARLPKIAALSLAL